MKGLQQLLSLFGFLLHISWKNFVTATGKRSFIIVVGWKRREDKHLCGRGGEGGIVL